MAPTSKKKDLDRWKGSNGAGVGWGRPDPVTGEKTMPPLQSEYLDWLLSDPRDPAKNDEWAALHDVHPDTCRRWKRNPLFIREWERRAKAKNISVDRVQSVVDALHRGAVQGDTKAAQLYLQYIDRFTPKVRIVNEDSTTQQLSDDDLVAELKRELADLPETSDPFA